MPASFVSRSCTGEIDRGVVFLIDLSRRNSYTLVLHKHGELLYQGVTECVTHKLMSTAITVTSASNDTLLEVIVREWDMHKLMMSMIRDILMYMVRARPLACASPLLLLLLRAGRCFCCCLFSPGIMAHACVIDCVRRCIPAGQNVLQAAEEDVRLRHGSAALPRQRRPRVRAFADLGLALCVDIAGLGLSSVICVRLCVFVCRVCVCVSLCLCLGLVASLWLGPT